MILKFLGILLYYLIHQKTQFYDEEWVSKHQFKRLKNLLEIASNSDYYNKLFKSIHFNVKKDFKSIEDLNKIPILCKDEVKNNPDLFLTRKPKYFDKIFYTSGSTGKPMKAYISWKHWIVEQSVIYRHWKWQGYKFRDTCGMIRSYSPKQGEPLIKYSWPLNTYYYSPFHLNDDNMKKYYNHMLIKNIKYLRGYPSSIKIFASFCKKYDLTIPTLKFILTASEVLNHEDRIFIEEVFNVKIGNHYGLAEQIVMFGNCGESNLLHNYNEYGYCELLATNNKNIFKIIGTNLNNDLMPLIRYDTGDLAIIDSNLKCSCNRKGLIIKNIIGRSDQIIKDSEGNKIPTVNFYTMMQYYTEILEWQIVINKNDHFTLKYTGPKLKKQRKQEIINGLNSRLVNTNFVISISNTDSLIKISEGKTKRIIYEK